MKLNQEINLPTSLFDVAEVTKDQRILYFMEERKIIIKSSVSLAHRDNNEKYGGRAVILTASQAHRRYPNVFTNSKARKFDGEMRTIILHVPSDMYVFCCRQGNITAYLRSLIKREMKKAQ